MKLQHRKKIMTFLISFLQLKFSSFFCWFIFFFAPKDSFSKLFPFLLRRSIKIFLAMGIECICRWLDVWWDLCWLLLSLFLYLLSFISNLDLKGRSLCFMYSSYVISSFLITKHLEQILFRFSRKAVSGKIINCILPSRFMKKLRKMKIISFGSFLSTSLIIQHFLSIFSESLRFSLRLSSELFLSLHHCSLVFGLSLTDVIQFDLENFLFKDFRCSMLVQIFSQHFSFNFPNVAKISQHGILWIYVGFM